MTPLDWEKSFIQNLHKGKGEALDHGNDRGLKLTVQVMKLLEWVLDSSARWEHWRDAVRLCTTGVIFIVCQLQQKYIAAANKQLYFAFIDLEKALDYVPRKVLWQALRSLDVDEWAMCVTQGMYHNARSHVRVNGQYSEEFGVGVGVHQGSVLSPLFFIPLLEALSRKFRTGVPWELLYADDLVLITDTQKERISKLKTWKAGIGSKGFCVKMTKTRFVVSGDVL